MLSETSSSEDVPQLDQDNSTQPMIMGVKRDRSKKTLSSRTRICIYVSGCLFETEYTTLLRIPGTRLHHIAKAYKQQQANAGPSSSSHYDYSEDKLARGYHFDRHPGAFAVILNYFRTGKLHCPLDMCGPMFEEELRFWGINDTQMEACCWNNYRTYRDTQKTLACLEEKDSSPESETEEDNLCRDSISEDTTTSQSHYCSCTRRVGKELREAFDKREVKRPISMTVAIVSMMMRIFSVVAMAVNTLPQVRITNTDTNLTSTDEFTVRTYLNNTYSNYAFHICEMISIAYFTLEIVVRLAFSNDRRRFMRMPPNWFDFIALCTSALAFYMDYFRPNKWNFLAIEGLQFLRIFRLIRLTRYFRALKIIAYTARASGRELLLLMVVFSIFVIFYGNMAFLMEQIIESEENQFRNLPYSWWWALVTITTVGYGDVVPKTAPGYLVAIVCSMSGLLVLALPVPIVINNFVHFYSHEVARRSMPKERRKRAFKTVSSAPVTSLERLTRAISVFRSPFFSEVAHPHA